MTKKLRTYKVWVKGRKEQTLTEKMAPNAELARIRFSAALGIKSYEVEAVWDRSVPAMQTGYIATR